MEIMEALSLARRSVEEADLPDEWQARAFAEVLRRLLGDNQVAVVGRLSSQKKEEIVPAADPAFGHLASRLGVSEAALADVFSIEGDEVSLHVPSAKLPPAKSRATREVALLIAAARQGAGIDDSWTDVSHVRNVLTLYNRYDASNFAKHLREIDDVFNLRGKPVQAIRLTRPGWEAATELARALAGSAGVS